MNRILILMGLCALMFLTNCTSKIKTEKEDQVHFLVTNPVKMDTSITKNYVCQIHSIRHIELRAQERGYLEKTFVDEGQWVKKGQLLFQIMPKLYEAQMQRDAAKADFAEIEYKNTKALADKNIVASNELAMAKAKYEKAKAELALTKVHLGFTEIRAPFDGIIDRFHVRQGSLVEEGNLLTNLSDNSKMWVYYNVPEAEYLDYKAEAKKNILVKVDLLMANNKQFDHSGVVEAIEADFDNETGNIPFRATFANPEGLLRHGETGNIKMNVPFSDALIIPQKATYEVLDKKYVFVVDQENRVKSREITIGTEMEDLYIITNGLDENDKILLEGIRKVRDHDKISYDYKAPTLVISQLKLHAE